MVLQILSLVFLVSSSNYCIEKTPGNCKKICQNAPEKFERTFDHIPSIDEISSGADDSTFYVADNVDFKYVFSEDNPNNIITCDPSIYLTYTEDVSYILVSDEVIKAKGYFNIHNIYDKIPIKFTISSSIEVDIDTSEKCNYPTITLNSNTPKSLLTFNFLTKNFKKNQFKIADESEIIQINEKIAPITDIVINNYKLEEIQKTYYCVSDREYKCQDYTSYNLTYIVSTAQITAKNPFIIIDSSVPQFFSNDPNKRFTHLVCLKDSKITYMPNQELYSDDITFSIDEFCIKINKCIFEGEGSFTFIPPTSRVFFSTYFGFKTLTNNNKYDITFKSTFPYNKEYSMIKLINNDNKYEFTNKIKIAEMSMFYGDAKLKKFFESDKIIETDSIITEGVTVASLKEYYYDDDQFRFMPGVHEIPITWRKEAIFRGIDKSGARFVFKDVYQFDEWNVDQFIKIYDYDLVQIYPAKYISIINYPCLDDSLKYEIHLDHDVIAYIGSFTSDSEEVLPDKCRITGNGKMKFIQPEYIKNYEKHCTIDSGIDLVAFEEEYPTIYVCVGKSSLNECKAEIEGVESIQNVEWLWYRNINTLSSVPYTKAFVTDEQKLFFVWYSIHNITLTPNAHLIVTVQDLVIRKNSINQFEAQKKSSKITVLFNSWNEYDYPLEKVYIKIDYQEAPTDIDFQIFLNFENVKLKMYYRDDYVPHSINLKGSAILHIREPFLAMLDIFNKPDTISFAINTDNDYQICIADEPIQCTGLDDFVQARNIQEFIDYDSVSIKSNVYIRKNISLSMNSNNYVSTYFEVYNNVAVTFDLPNDAYLPFRSQEFEIIADKSYYFKIDMTSINQYFIFDIKNSVTIYPSYLFYKVEFISSFETSEIITGESISADYFKFPNNFVITSPVPQYLNSILNAKVIRSTSWTYLYFNEEGKEMLDSVESLPFQNYIDSDEGLSENILLAIGKNDIISVPSNWMNKHNVYFLHGNNKIIIDKPLKVNYLQNGIEIEDNFKIIHGTFEINAKDTFTLNAYLPEGYRILEYMYDAEINCNENSQTNIKTGSLISNQNFNLNLIYIYGYDKTNNKLTIIFKNEDDSYEFNFLSKLSDKDAVKYDFGYDYICYCPTKDMESTCTGKFYHAADMPSFIAVVKDNKNVPIIVAQDLIIPYSTGDHLILNPINSNIKISLPEGPESISFLENDKINVKYSDSTDIDISSKAIIDVELKKSIFIDIESITQSSISFSLGSNVVIDTKSVVNSIFKIPVQKNGHLLYAEDVDKFNQIFDVSVDFYNRVCAYELNDDSLCTFSKSENIKNVFTDPFVYNEVEIAPISSPNSIMLPSISETIEVNILPKSTDILTVERANSLYIDSQIILINDRWIFRGDRNHLKIKLDTCSSLSIPEIVSMPITLQLTDSQSSIDLKNFAHQNSKQIKMIKHGDVLNTVTIYGSSEIYSNFKKSLNEYEGIKFISDSTQKYLCFCKKEETCRECEEKVKGIVTVTNKILSEPGENVDILLFDDLEISSNIFTNKHDIYKDLNCKINITDVKSVNQKIDYKFIVDNLHFDNSDNLLLKPRDPVLNITIRTENAGPQFTIDIDTYLKLNVPNIKEENIKASKLFVTGKGELNVYDYPYNKIKANSTVKLIKGVYTICNSKGNNSVCSYDSAAQYKQIESCFDFREDFDPDSKIVVFLDSFLSSIDVNIRYLKMQKIQFIRRPDSLNLLQNQNQNKLRILSATEITSKSDLTELSGSVGGALLDNSDSDLFVVGFDESLTIKQEGEIKANNNPITIQPKNDKATIIIDDSVDIYKQKVRIESNEGKNIHVSVLSNKESNDINKFIEVDSSKIDITYDDNNGKNTQPKKTKKGMPKGAVFGILIGVLAVVAIIAIIAVTLSKKKKEKVSNSISDNTDNN